MHILFGVLTGAIAQCSYKCLKHDEYTAGVILGIAALLCAMAAGYCCAG